MQIIRLGPPFFCFKTSFNYKNAKPKPLGVSETRSFCCSLGVDIALCRRGGFLHGVHLISTLEKPWEKPLGESRVSPFFFKELFLVTIANCDLTPLKTLHGWKIIILDIHLWMVSKMFCFHPLLRGNDPIWWIFSRWLVYLVYIFILGCWKIQFDKVLDFFFAGWFLTSWDPVILITIKRTTILGA